MHGLLAALAFLGAGLDGPALTALRYYAGRARCRLHLCRNCQRNPRSWGWYG